jgi:pilus assembly protein Flp/PilA
LLRTIRPLSLNGFQVLPKKTVMVSPKAVKMDLWCFIFDESGQDLVEYVLIVALISLGALASLHSLAGVLANVPNALMQKFLAAYNS